MSILCVEYSHRMRNIMSWEKIFPRYSKKSPIVLTMSRAQIFCIISKILFSVSWPPNTAIIL